VLTISFSILVILIVLLHYAIIFANLSEIGEAAGVLTVTSNAFNMPEVQFPVTANGLAVPAIVIEPDVIEVFLNTGDVVEETISVSNDGGSRLVFAIESEVISEPERDARVRDVRSVGQVGPNRDDPGDIIAQFNHDVPGNQYKNGAWDPDHEWMWVQQYNNPYNTYAYDFNDDYAQVQNFSVGAVNPMDLAYHDGIIYVMWLWNPTLNRFDIEGNNIGSLALQGHQGINGVAVSHEHEVILAAEGSGDPHNLNVFDLEGNQIARMGADSSKGWKRARSSHSTFSEHWKK